MKLYSMKPLSHGELSYFVMAENETEAKNKVNSYCKKMGDNGTQTYRKYRIGETDHMWEVEEEFLGVAVNCND